MSDWSSWSKERLVERKETVVSELLVLQSRLGQKIMFDDAGNVLSLKEFTLKRNALKNMVVVRQKEILRLNQKIKSLHVPPTPRVKGVPTPPRKDGESRSQAIRVAFGLICEDAANDNLPILETPKDIADFYIDLALQK